MLRRYLIFIDGSLPCRTPFTCNALRAAVGGGSLPRSEWSVLPIYCPVVQWVRAEHTSLRAAVQDQIGGMDARGGSERYQPSPHGRSEAKHRTKRDHPSRLVTSWTILRELKIRGPSGRGGSSSSPGRLQPLTD